MEEWFLVFDFDATLWANDDGVIHAHEGVLDDRVIDCLFVLGEAIVEQVDEVDNEIIRIVLLVAREL